MMTVRALFFASYRDVVGRDEMDLEVPPGASVRELVRLLRERGGGWARLPEAPVAAVNMEYVDLSTRLREGDEIAFIPPVSGG